MVNVFITIDTELYPRTLDWAKNHLGEEMERFIYGVTPGGEFGIRYQSQLLARYGLKAVFFVESLFACAAGVTPLRKIVSCVEEGGHDVELHLHTEWLRWIVDQTLPKKAGNNIRDFTVEEQATLIEKAVMNLEASSGKRPCAFRAGNYGANRDTLRALAKNGIRFDTSYNPSYLNSSCGLVMDKVMTEPHRVEGIWEMPIMVFEDWPGHLRHLQLCACSWLEIQDCLMWAWKNNVESIVLVSHSFEMLKRPIRCDVPSSINRVVVRRFEQLCSFLALHRDKFSTRGFSDIPDTWVPRNVAPQLHNSSLWKTAHRYLEQGVATYV